MQIKPTVPIRFERSIIFKYPYVTNVQKVKKNISNLFKKKKKNNWYLNFYVEKKKNRDNFRIAENVCVWMDFINVFST